MDMYFEQLNSGACKTYLMGSKSSSDVILVDPVIELVNNYVDYLKKNNYNLKAVIDTHTHADHISGGAALKDITDCEYIMHDKAPSQCVTKRIKDGDVLDVAGIPIKVMESHGHTSDSISLIMSDRVLTGDALFLDDGGAGRDDLPGGDPGVHWETLQQFMELDDRLIVYPAHEYRNREPSSLARQKRTNSHLKPRTKDDYVQYLEDLRLGPADWMKEVLKANYACARDPEAAWIPIDSPACEIIGTLDKGVNEQHPDVISAEKLKMRIDEGEKPILLDVREAHELRGPLGHIPGIIHIPIARLPSRLSELEKSEEVVTVCRSGARAYSAAQIMKQAGFKRVSVLNGGMIAYNSA
ncbi:MAG: MBL fold metallo-hydrolase [Candidatus Hodarchaeales archaeon]|jgi:glyoxylase-like metal-dependent hydrolase (beta-lactamase superfamily II)